VWDFDPENGSGFFLGVEAKVKRAARSIFDKTRGREKLVRKPEHEKLWLLPVDENVRDRGRF